MRSHGRPERRRTLLERHEWRHSAWLTASLRLVQRAFWLVQRMADETGQATDCERRAEGPALNLTTDSVPHLTQSTQQVVQSPSDPLVEAASAVSVAFSPIQGDI